MYIQDDEAKFVCVCRAGTTGELCERGRSLEIMVQHAKCISRMMRLNLYVSVELVLPESCVKGVSHFLGSTVCPRKSWLQQMVDPPIILL